MSHRLVRLNLIAVAALTFAAVAAFSQGTARAQAIFSPLAVPVNTAGDAGADVAIANTINQSGLSTGFISGVTDFDAYISSDPRHTVEFADAEWFASGGMTTGTIIYDLGAGARFDRLALWNEESFGIASMTVDASNDLAFADAVVGLGVFFPTDVTGFDDYPAQVFTFAPTTARYVRLQVQAPQNAPSVSMGEIAFRSAAIGAAAVPEASTFALALPALGMVGAVVNRRRKK